MSKYAIRDYSSKAFEEWMDSLLESGRSYTAGPEAMQDTALELLMQVCQEITENNARLDALWDEDDDRSTALAAERETLAGRLDLIRGTIELLMSHIDQAYPSLES